MDAKMELYYNNIKKIDNTIANITNKSTEIESKIGMLKNKKNLKLEDATQLLKFQHDIITTEIKHLKNALPVKKLIFIPDVAPNHVLLIRCELQEVVVSVVKQKEDLILFFFLMRIKIKHKKTTWKRENKFLSE